MYLPADWGMKIQTYEEPGLTVQWRTPYEGPNSFLTYWPSVSRIFLSKAELLAAVPSASPEFLEWLGSVGCDEPLLVTGD